MSDSGFTITASLVLFYGGPHHVILSIPNQVVFVAGEQSTADMIEGLLKEDGVSVDGVLAETEFAQLIEKHILHSAVSSSITT